MLPEEAAARYHAGNDPRLAEALVNNREAASIAAIYREVRAAIYAGEYEPGDRLPTRAALAKQKQVSPESITIVMRMLAAERLVSSEQGRGTFAVARRRFAVRVSLQRVARDGASPAELTAAIAAAAGDEPAASPPEYDVAPPYFAATMAIETGGFSQAVSIGEAIAEEALRRVGGWEIEAASVTAGPA